jgi:Ferric reductase like transmembrane component
MGGISKAVFGASADSILGRLDWNTHRPVRLRMVCTPPWEEGLTDRLRQGRDPRLAATNRIGYSVSLSRGAGICIAFDSALILLPMLRTIITYIYPAFDFLALDENIWFHRQVAYAILFFTIIHVTGFYVNFYMIELLKIRPEDAYELLYKSWAGTTGWIMCLAMFLMYTTSVKETRLMSFEVFRYTHFLYWVYFIGTYPMEVLLMASFVDACGWMFRQICPSSECESFFRGPRERRKGAMSRI